nr:Alba domain-containing protein [Ipomoea batatas]
MEEITEGVTNINISAGDLQKKNRIQVSSTKKPLFFYVNLAKRYMQQYSEVELSALGMGMASLASLLSFSGFYAKLPMEFYFLNSLSVSGFYVHIVILMSRTIATVVSVAEILKNNGLAVEKTVFHTVQHLPAKLNLAERIIYPWSDLLFLLYCANPPKKNIYVAEIMTSTVDVKDDSRGRPISKAKIEIVLGKSEKFDEIMAAAASEKDRGDGEVQS